MIETAKKQLKAFSKALKALNETLELPKDPIVRDAAILRFELTFETGWKATQTLERYQGLEANSPRKVFEEAFRLGWVREETIWEAILATRNQAVHVYSEQLADAVYWKLRDFARAFAGLEHSLEVELD